MIVRTVLVFSLKTTVERSGYDVRNISGARTYFVLVWKKILFVKLVGDKHLFVPIYIFCIYNFLNCVIILCAFCVNYLSPQFRNTCTPN
jgi:hypothetical protein